MSSVAEERISVRRRRIPAWLEIPLLLVIAVLLAVIIKTFFVQAFYIPSGSMEPGLVKDDRILVEKHSDWFDDGPGRGDVVVFEDPGGWLSEQESAGPEGAVASVMSKIGLYPTGGHLVKRVIGVAGDTIACCDDQGRILVNGQPLDEGSYILDAGIPCNGPMPGNCNWTAGPVPDGHVFVMGDNRGNSADSSVRLCANPGSGCDPNAPFVPTDLIVGKVFVLLWPSDHFDWLSRPGTFQGVPNA